MIICKKCGGTQVYTQIIYGIKWVICPQCQYEERIKHYFDKNDKKIIE